MKKYLKILCLFLFFNFVSCSVFAEIKIPYIISGNITFEESEKYDFLGLNFRLKNKSPKKMNKVTLVFYVFDENGEPPLCVKNHIVLTLNCEIEPGEILEDCISLDKYVFNLDSEYYEIDYLYVSQIVYEDETTWNDPFGNYMSYW